MAEPNCGSCDFRAKYDNNPKSILGRLWRWHTNFCPGWKAYMAWLPEDQRKTLIEKYQYPPNKFAA